LNYLNGKYIDFGNLFDLEDFIKSENVLLECVKDKNSKKIEEQLNFLKDIFKIENERHFLKSKII
jgi:hypothetical protein